MRDPVARSARSTSACAWALVREIVAAELIIGDFRTFFVPTWTILSAMVMDMKGTYEQNSERIDTWTHISVAAERVLTEVEEAKEKRTEVDAEADRGAKESSEDGKDAGDAGLLLVLKRKPRAGALVVREEGST